MNQTAQGTIPLLPTDIFRTKLDLIEQGTTKKVTPPFKVHINVNAKSITFVLFAMAGTLVLASIGLMLADYLTGNSSVLLHKLVKLFSVDLELNVPSFFSTMLLLISSILLATITLIKHKGKAPFALHWGVLAAGFLFMAFDETISIHERLIEPVRAMLGEVNLGIFYFAWVLPAAVLIAALSIFFLRFLIDLPKKVSLWFLISAALYLGAAVGLELLEGKHVEIYGKNNLLYLTLTTIEETLEMVGIILFIRVLVLYMGDVVKGLQFGFERRDHNVLKFQNKSIKRDGRPAHFPPGHGAVVMAGGRGRRSYANAVYVKPADSIAGA